MSIKKILKDALTIKFDQAFGLDISDRSVEIVELEKVFRFSVKTYGRTELAEGIVSNGQILDANALAEKIKRLLKDVKPKRVSTNKVIVSLPESQVFIQCFVLDANLKSNVLKQAIIDKVSLLMPIGVDKTYWDYDVKPLPDKNKKLIIFISVPKDIATGYVKFCNSIGLEVVSLCVESLSLARAILKKSDKQSLIMDIGAHSTNLSFFDSNDKINMSVTVPVAGADFTETIKARLKIENNEAESLKAKFGIKDVKENNIREIIMPMIEDILKETEGAIKYYEETFKQKLDDIYLLGGSALLPGLVELIKGRLKKEVQVVKNGNNINLNSFGGKDKDFSIFANVIGLGMLGASGEFKDLNLLRQMPSSATNAVNKLSLFNMGYLSRVNTIRTIINNKYILIILVILIGLIFAILIQQAENYGFASVYSTSL
ncbi:MAG: pilus assembly protein PilM [Candidatus Paceibacterota bacterium]